MSLYSHKHKFSAKKCERDGRKFPSLLERRYYDQLKIRERAGDVLFFLCQVPFHLPGNVKYVCDFQIFLKNGEVEFVDTKGFDTALSIAKRKLVESVYPVKIKIIKEV